MRHLRARRLSEAAKALRAGAPDILQVALDAGYSSHEAFTRRFCKQFGMTPDAYRARRSRRPVKLTEAFPMHTVSKHQLEPPRFERRERIYFVGLEERHAMATGLNVLGQWQRFTPFMEDIPGRMDAAVYGVTLAFDPRDGGFTYLCAVEVEGGETPPPGLKAVVIPPQLYAVFRHRGHASAIGETNAAIWHGWLPNSGFKQSEALSGFERYDAAFDPATGEGGFEIWLPLAQ
jgi:AraC family transcriptional regulator